jgi:hypothetical protein
MNKYQKAKLTLSIDSEILKEAKEASSKKRIPISRLVENFLRWIVNPDVYCFKCGMKFSANHAELCPKCGWLVCPKCKACRCELSEEAAMSIFYLRKTLEDLLGGRIK